MRLPPDQALYAASVSLKCEVCGEPAGVFAVKDAPLCIRAECKNVVAQKKRMNAAGYRQFFDLQSRQIRFGIEQAKAKREQLAEKRRKEEQHYVAFLKQQVAKKLGIDPANYPHVMISKNIRSITTLSKKRKAAFYAFLLNLVAETARDLQDPERSDDKQNYESFGSSPPYPIEVKACEVCAGACCTKGENHAYLSKETIARYLTFHPDHSQDQIVQAHMACLPNLVYENSCAFHTETGCRLPRNLRSSTCNEFKCDALIDMNTTLQESPDTKGFLVVEQMAKNWRETLSDGIDSRLFPSLVRPDPQ